MKMNKTRKIVAFVLAIVMILPMISVPSFAADTHVYTVYTNGFEGKTFDTDLDGDGVNDAYKMVAGEDSLKDFGEDYIIKDPTGADDGVWSISMAEITSTQVTGIRPTYVDYGTVFFENDVYVPTGSTGQARWNMYGSAAYADDSGEERRWFTLYDLNLNGAKILMPDSSEIALKKDTWFTVSYSLEMTTGAVALYVNGDSVYTGTLLHGGKALDLVRMELFYNSKVDIRGLGNLYVDNINIFEGSAPSNHLKRVPIFQKNFDGQAFDTDLNGDGINDAHKIVDAESGFRYDDDEGLNLYLDNKGSTNYHYVMGDPTSNYADNGAWRIPMGQDNYDNYAHILPAMTNAAYQYSKLVVEMDLYVPAGITSCWARWRSWSGRNPAGEAGGYHVFMDLDLSSAKISCGGVSYTLSKETWYTVSMCIDFAGGVVNIYVDNVLAITHDLGDNLVIGNFWFAMVDDYGSADHYLWVDNINIFSGNEPTGGILESAPLSPIYSNTMEGKRFDTDLNGDGINDAHILTDADGIGYSDDRPNAGIDEYFESNGGEASANDYHYFVQDPTGALNDVWRIPMGVSNQDNWGHLIIGRDPFSYASTQKVLLENDVYISEDSAGDVNWQIYAGAFKSLYNLNLGSAALYIDEGHHSNVSVVGNMQLQKEQWYRLSYMMDLVNGDWSLYVDGVLTATGNINLTNIAVIWLWNARLLKGPTSFGSLYVDNIKVYAANDLSSVYTEKTASVDGSKALQYIDVTVNGKTVKTLATKYLVAVSDDTYKASPVYFNESGEFDGIVTNVGKTSVRYGNGSEENPAGLRFAAEIDLDLLAQLEQMVEEGTLKDASIGIRIAPTDYIQKVEGVNSEPIADSLADLIPGRTVIDLPIKKGQWYDFGDAEHFPGTYFVGSIVNIKVPNYGRAFSAAGYVKVTLLSGEDVYLLSDTHSADIKTVSAGVLELYGDRLGTRQKEILENYVAGISNGESVRRKQVAMLQDLNVLAIGDSLFDGDFVSGDKQWIGLLAKECSWNLTNLGQDGWTVAYNPEIYPDSVSARPSMAYHLLNNENYKYGSTSYYYQNNRETPFGGAEEVDLILLEGGTNDFNWGMPLGEVTSTDIGTLYGALNTMIETLLDTYTEAKIVLVTTWHKTGTRDDGAAALDFVANALKNIKSTNYSDDDNVILLDAGDPAVSGIEMSNEAFRAEYSKSVDDTAHLNEKGMELMATNMLKALSEIVKSNSAEK